MKTLWNLDPNIDIECFASYHCAQLYFTVVTVDDPLKSKYLFILRVASCEFGYCWGILVLPEDYTNKEQGISFRASGRKEILFFIVNSEFEKQCQIDF